MFLPHEEDGRHDAAIGVGSRAFFHDGSGQADCRQLRPAMRSNTSSIPGTIPLTVEVSRATDAVANASAREIGRATGSVVGNAAFAVAPSAAFGKISAASRLRKAVPSSSYDPPQIGWVKENLRRETAAKRYNDAATGARPGANVDADDV